jgi:hypothetical protein
MPGSTQCPSVEVDDAFEGPLIVGGNDGTKDDGAALFRGTVKSHTLFDNNDDGEDWYDNGNVGVVTSLSRPLTKSSQILDGLGLVRLVLT